MAIVETEYCVISDLISKPFSEKNEIIKIGRPCPIIPNLTSVHKDKKENIFDILILHEYEQIKQLVIT